jgi:hypothetical protein
MQNRNIGGRQSGINMMKSTPRGGFTSATMAALFFGASTPLAKLAILAADPVLVACLL